MRLYQKAYSAWHKNPFHKPIHWASLILFVLFLSSAILLSYEQLQTVPKIFALNIKNAHGEVINGRIEFLGDDSNEVLGEGISSNLTATATVAVGAGNKKIKFVPDNGLLTSLEYDDVELDEKSKSKQDEVEIALDEPPTPPGWDKVLAIGDVKGFSFSKGRYKKIAQGKDLFKCPDWDFANQKCNGRWVKRADLVPGQEYTVEFAPGDPGYAESSKKVNVLNKKNELLDYVETTPTAVEVIVTIDTSLPATTIPVQEIALSQLDTASLNNDLVIDVVDVVSDPIAEKAIIIDTTNLAAAETKITNTATSNKLLTCVNYQETDNTCARWKREKNIVPDEVYNVTISSPGKSVFGQSRDGLLVLDKNYEVIAGNQQVTNENSASKVAMQFVDMNPYKITTYLDSASTTGTQEIVVGVRDNTIETGNGKTMSFDLSAFSASSADIEATAVGYDLFHCNDFDVTNQICNGKYKKVKDLNKNESYSFNIEKKGGVSELFESKKQISLLDKDDQLFDYTETSAGTDVEITPIAPVIIKKIKIKNHTENTSNDLKINEAFPLPREDAVQSYAIDPTGLAATTELEIEAKGKSLYKCKDWDFANSACLGTWEKYKNLNPGEIYTLPIDSLDPGFMETNDTPAPAQTGGGGGGSSYVEQAVESKPAVSPEPTTPTSSVTSDTTNPSAPIASNSVSSSNVLNKNYAIITAPKIEFEKDLEFGSRGQDVKELQQFLNRNDFLVAKTSYGSPGKETSYFGPLTQNAVVRFQQAGASEILIPAGLEKPTGIVGPQTRKFINSFLK